VEKAAAKAPAQSAPAAQPAAQAPKSNAKLTYAQRAKETTATAAAAPAAAPVVSAPEATAAQTETAVPAAAPAQASSGPEAKRNGAQGTSWTKSSGSSWSASKGPAAAPSPDKIFIAGLPNDSNAEEVTKFIEVVTQSVPQHVHFAKGSKDSPTAGFALVDLASTEIGEKIVGKVLRFRGTFDVKIRLNDHGQSRKARPEGRTEHRGDKDAARTEKAAADGGEWTDGRPARRPNNGADRRPRTDRPRDGAKKQGSN